MQTSDRTIPWRLAGWLLAAATAGYTGVLLFMTHHPRPHALIGPNAPSDKTLHVWAYGVLALFAAATLAAWGRWRPRAVAWLAGGLAAFGVCDELTQPLPWFRRTSDPVDWLYDCVGIALGLALIATGVAVARMAPPARRIDSPAGCRADGSPERPPGRFGDQAGGGQDGTAGAPVSNSALAPGSRRS